MLVAVAGVSHRSAPVEVREKVAFPPCASRKFLEKIKERGIAEEAVLVSTCNRSEVYAVVQDESKRSMLLEEISTDRGVGLEVLDASAYWLTDAEAVRHLYRVVSSLDSMVVGEAQILGQVREAYRMATEAKCSGPVLNRLFHSSFRTGKRVRHETEIGNKPVSIPYAAVRLAEEVFGSLRGRIALVLGAGAMSELVIKHLKSRGIGEVRIANRTPERARALAERVQGHAVSFDALPAQLREVDVVVSSTGAGNWVVNSDMVSAAMQYRENPLFFIDIAVPRDIDPAVQNLEKAYVYDIDDLRAVAERNSHNRSSAAAAAEKIVDAAVFEYMGWLSTLHLVPIIKELRDRAERIRQHELSRTLSKLNLSPEEAHAVERLSYSLMNKLLHEPISELKSLAASGATVNSAEIGKRLLSLEGMGIELYRSGPA